MEKVMMACGHTANGTLANGEPCCAICSCTEVVKKPLLEGRKARCSYCGKETDSNYGLAFFEFRPEKEYDLYYCGCEGWD